MKSAGLFECIGLCCWRVIRLLLYNKRWWWLVHWLNGWWRRIRITTTTLWDTALICNSSNTPSDWTIVLVVRLFISFYYNVIWNLFLLLLLLLLRSTTDVIEAQVKLLGLLLNMHVIEFCLLLNMHVIGVDDIIHVILIHALVHSCQMNVVAVLLPLVVLGNLVVKG